jgi:hypothetical protein
LSGHQPSLLSAIVQDEYRPDMRTSPTTPVTERSSAPESLGTHKAAVYREKKSRTLGMIMSSNNVLCTFHGNVPFVAALLKAEARFLVVGGLAVKFYRRDRVVDDLDLLIEPTVSNAERVLGALSKFDPTHGRLPEELVAPGIHLQLKTFLYPIIRNQSLDRIRRRRKRRKESTKLRNRERAKEVRRQRAARKGGK